MTNHLEPATIYALLDGVLDPAAEGSAEAHLLRCDECRAVREECALTLGSLRFYATASPAPPSGYWDGFWARFQERVARVPVEGVPFRVRKRPWATPALAAAAVVSLLLGAWWASGPREGEEPLSTDPTVAARSVVAETGWESDLEFFERATVAVGGVDPLSKGIVLASMAESP